MLKHLRTSRINIKCKIVPLLLFSFSGPKCCDVQKLLLLKYFLKHSPH